MEEENLREWLGWCVDLQEFREVLRSKVTDSLQREGANLEIDGIFDQELVELLKDRNKNVIHDAGGRVLKQFKRITVVNVGGFQGVNKR